jgi:hypothetical protein
MKAASTSETSADFYQTTRGTQKAAIFKEYFIGWASLSHDKQKKV